MKKVILIATIILLAITTVNAQNIVRLDETTFKIKVWNYEKNSEWKLAGEIPVIVIFYADWCSPCKKMETELKAVQKEYANKIQFYKIDIEKQPQLAKLFNVKSIPTIIYASKNGNYKKQVGYRSRDQLKGILQTIQTSSNAENISQNEKETNKIINDQIPIINNSFTKEVKQLPHFDNFIVKIIKNNNKPYKDVTIKGNNILFTTNELGEKSYSTPKKTSIITFKKGFKTFKKKINFHKDSIYNVNLKLHKPENTTFQLKVTDLETLIYHRIKANNEIEILNAFVERFPSGKYKSDIENKIENLRYQEVINKNTISLYKLYLSYYPKGNYVSQIGKAYDNNLFQVAKQNNSIQAYKTYIDESPFDFQKEKAVTLAYENAKNINTKKSFNKFVQLFPNSSFSLEAKKNAITREEYEYYNATKKGTIKNCNTYLSKYKNGRYVSTVNKRKQLLIKQDSNYQKAIKGNKKDCDAYLSHYPSGKYIDKVQERKSYLEICMSAKISDIDKFLKKYPNGKYYNDIYKQKSDLIILDNCCNHLKSNQGYKEYKNLGDKKIDFSRNFEIILDVDIDKRITNTKHYKGSGNYKFSFSEIDIWVSKDEISIKKNKKRLCSKKKYTGTGKQTLKIQKQEDDYIIYFKGSKICRTDCHYPSDNEMPFYFETYWGIDLTFDLTIRYTSLSKSYSEYGLYSEAKSGNITDCDKFINMFPESRYLIEIIKHKHRLEFFKKHPSADEDNIKIMYDERDKKAYAVIKLRNIWCMAETLDYLRGGEASFSSDYCRYYSKKIAIQNNVCPSGWEIPIWLAKEQIFLGQNHKLKKYLKKTGYLHHISGDGFMEGKWHSYNCIGEFSSFWTRFEDGTNACDLDIDIGDIGDGRCGVDFHKDEGHYLPIICISKSWSPED